MDHEPGQCVGRKAIWIAACSTPQQCRLQRLPAPGSLQCSPASSGAMGHGPWSLTAVASSDPNLTSYTVLDLRSGRLPIRGRARTDLTGLQPCASLGCYCAAGAEPGQSAGAVAGSASDRSAGSQPLPGRQRTAAHPKARRHWPRRHRCSVI